MAEIINFLVEMPFWYWWVLAALLLITEILTGTTYVLWPATAAAIVGLVSIGPLHGQWQFQLFLFASLTFLLTIFATPYAKKWLHAGKRDHENLNKRGAQKIGRRVRVDAGFVNGQGKVRLGDTLWLARSEDGSNPETNADVVVSSVDGTTLIVRS